MKIRKSFGTIVLYHCLTWQEASCFGSTTLRPSFRNPSFQSAPAIDTVSTSLRRKVFPESHKDGRRSKTATSLDLSVKDAVTAAEASMGINSYFLTRIIFLRGLAFVHFVAFTVALRQNRGLIGDNGITPARDILNTVEERARDRRKRRDNWWKDQKAQGKTLVPQHRSIHANDDFISILKNTKVGKMIGDKLNSSEKFQDLREVLWDRSDRLGRLYPTVLWLLSKDERDKNMNIHLDKIAWSGITLSSLMFALGAANVPLLLGLWICQRSIMSVGNIWYGFGWEPQLAETTFHALFLVPFLSLNQIPVHTPVPTVVLWSMRWLLFRIMIGAGLIKLRSRDPKWRLSGPEKLSTMDYFYETQPVPNPLSKYFHRMPKFWHKFEVLSNHFVELIAPLLLILPVGRRLRIAGGMIQLLFQSVLITSGNLSFLNWLTMLPAIFCFDDAFVSKLFSKGFTTAASIASYTNFYSPTVCARQIINILFISLIAKLSIPVVKNLLSKKQIMNGSFDQLRLVNTYGAFGVVQIERIELIIEASHNSDGPWEEYIFKVKPGPLRRPPRFITPYHYRLDWLMWIAAGGGDVSRNPWIFRLLKKLLEQEPDVTKLLQSDPFKDSQKPRYIRLSRYRYRFGGKGETYWVREKLEDCFTYSMDDLNVKIR